MPDPIERIVSLLRLNFTSNVTPAMRAARCPRFFAGPPSTIGKNFQPPRRLGRAEVPCLLVPAARLVDVRGDSAYAELCKHARVIGGAQRQRAVAVAGCRRTPEQKTRRHQIAGVDELLPLSQEQLDRLRVDRAHRLSGGGGGFARPPPPHPC